MKTRYDIITIFALAVLASAGCRQTPLEEPEGDSISFGTAVTSAQSTRSGAGTSLIDTESELQASSFGVFGYRSLDDTKEFKNVFSSSAAQEVKYTTTAVQNTDSNGDTYTVEANSWWYAVRQKWNKAMHYRFRAFWPYDKAINNVNNGSTAKLLIIEYKQKYDYDLMVAYNTRFPRNEGVGRVPMKFHHALAGLRFKFRYKESESLVNVSDIVTGLYVTGLNLTGSLIYGEAKSTDTAESIRWNIGENSFDSSTKLFSWTGATTGDDVRNFAVGATTSDVTEATVFDNDKVVFAIPQTLSADIYHETYVHFTTKEGGTAEQSAKLWDYTEDKPVTLEPGKIYTFTLVIGGSSVKVNIDIEDWTETQSNVDIYF